ncbi:MAG: 7TMR-DISMED2 domain-containing protein, partial [Caldilineaceae bacterium]
MSNSGRFGFARQVGARLALVLVLCVCWLTSWVQAAPVDQALVVGQVQVLEEPAATATLDQILAQRPHFADLHSTAPNFGFTLAAYWLRIPVQNHTNAPQVFYLDIKNSILDYATLYVVSAGKL